jgi:hypothetical protein
MPREMAEPFPSSPGDRERTVEWVREEIAASSDIPESLKPEL